MKGSREHISARVDKELLDLFTRDRDEKFEGNSTRCLTESFGIFMGSRP